MVTSTGGNHRARGWLRVALAVIGVLAAVVGVLALLELFARLGRGASAAPVLVYAIAAFGIALLCLRAVRRSIRGEGPGGDRRAMSGLGAGLLQLGLLLVGGIALVLAAAALFDSTPTTSPADMVMLRRVVGAAAGAFGGVCLYAAYALQRRKREDTAG
ncbi:MAG: hypothetical protein JNK67_32230 [Alphaproteobacteria bacterium]|nr:hypothetical protein [Alphaproteobacteria bacterium]